MPEGNYKTFPNYIPMEIREDYQEACLIKDLSPKASATLARRCLQSMVEDFWKVSKNKNLHDQLIELKSKIREVTWKAIGKIREIGNIGAHMKIEKGKIINVDIGEAASLLWLIEYLMDEWYIKQHEDEKKLEEVSLLKSKN